MLYHYLLLTENETFTYKLNYIMATIRNILEEIGLPEIRKQPKLFIR